MMNRQITKLILAYSTLLALSFADAQAQKLPEVHFEEWKQMNESKAETMEWFQDSKYGMFIHWGISAIAGGIWDGVKIHEMRRPHVAEWIQYAAKIPREEYAQLAKSFNPINFDAHAITKLAKAAGMKYLVITTKHHDGFALFDTKYSDFDIMDATPFKRDVIKELYEACKREGLAFGIYYSHNIDWADGSDSRFAEYKEKGWKLERPNLNLAFGANTWDPSPNTFDEYLDNKAIPQVKELLTNFPGMKCVWFDMSHRMDAEQSFRFYQTVYSIQPQVIITDRIGNGFGDYSIPGDNKIPKNLDQIVKPWETVGTFNNSWGFNGYDQDWKSPKEILFWLVEIVSKGGNYMLNIGPTGLGGVPKESVDNLLEVGKWLEVNGEAIYNTDKWVVTHEGPTNVNMNSTHARERDGFNATFTSQDIWFTQKGEDVYAIAFQYPKDSVLIKSLKEGTKKVTAVSLVGSDAQLAWKQTKEGLEVGLGSEKTGKNGYVLKIEF